MSATATALTYERSCLPDLKQGDGRHDLVGGEGENQRVPERSERKIERERFGLCQRISVSFDSLFLPGPRIHLIPARPILGLPRLPL